MSVQLENFNKGQCVTIPIGDYEVVYLNDQLIAGTRENTSVPVPGAEETTDEGGGDTTPKLITGKLQAVRHPPVVTIKAEIAAEEDKEEDSQNGNNSADDAVREGEGKEEDDDGGGDDDDDEDFEEGDGWRC